MTSPSPSRDNTGQEPDRFQQYPYRFITGQKIKFKSEKQRYTVQCESRRYAICTKPFNAQKTVLYCIIDQWRNVRGPENLVFGMGAETREECLEMLVRLLDNESEVSYRHYAPLDIEAVYEGNDVVAPRSEATTPPVKSAQDGPDKPNRRT